MIRNSALQFALAVTLACVPSVAQAQVIVAARGGLNFANVDGDDVLVNTDTKTGLNLGGSITVPFSDNLGVLLGAIYSQKGAKFSPEDVELTLGLDYAELPVLLALTLPTEGPFGGRFYLGPAFAFEMNCEVEASSGGVDVSADCDQIDDELGEDSIETETFEVGGVGGVGLTWDGSERFQLSLDLFYNFGLTSIVDGEDAKHRTVALQAGLGFPL